LEALMRGPIGSTYAGPDWKHLCGARLEALVRGPIGSTCAGPDWKHLCGARLEALLRGPNERTYAGLPEREHQLIMVEIGDAKE